MDMQHYKALPRSNSTLNNTSQISYELQKPPSLIDALSESSIYMDSGYHSSHASSFSLNNENMVNNSLDQSTKQHSLNLSNIENVNKKILNVNNSQITAKKPDNSSYFNYTTKDTSKERVFKENSSSRFSEIKYSPINYYKQKKKFTKTRSESINSSTPIRDFEKSSYFESAEKSISLSKFEKSKFKNHKSFSPGKHAYFKKLAIDKSFLTNVYSYTNEPEVMSNPAKRLLLFDENKFEKLLNYNGSEKKVLQSAPELKKPPKKSQKNKILKRQDAVSDRNIPENFISPQNNNQKNTLSEPYIRNYFREMKTLDTQNTDKQHIAANNLRTADSLEFLKIDSFEGETKPIIVKRKLADSEVHDSAKKIRSEIFGINHLILEDNKISTIPDKFVASKVATAPKSTNRKLKRSLSLDYDPEKEACKILHPYLPCTPPKKKPRRAVQRVLYATNKSPVKRSLYELKHKITSRASYEGIEKFNILVHLQNTLPALDIILNCMSGSDLQNMSLVSKKWKCLVESNSKYNLKRLKFISSVDLIKENFMAEKYLYSLKHQHSMPLRDFNSRSKNSFDRKRSIDEMVSPPVSPSKRKFHENQKIVKKLDEHAKIVLCPRCLKSSRVITHTARYNQSNNVKRRILLDKIEYNNKGVLSKSVSDPTGLKDRNSIFIQHYDSFDGRITNQDFIIRSIKYNANQQISRSDSKMFAVCSSENCRFNFCINCRNEVHPNRRCLELEPFSPTKEEPRNVCKHVTNHKKNLRRL